MAAAVATEGASHRMHGRPMLGKCGQARYCESKTQTLDPKPQKVGRTPQCPPAALSAAGLPERPQRARPSQPPCSVPAAHSMLHGEAVRQMWLLAADLQLQRVAHAALADWQLRVLAFSCARQYKAAWLQ